MWMDAEHTVCLYMGHAFTRKEWEATYRYQPEHLNPWTGEGRTDPSDWHIFQSVFYTGPSAPHSEEWEATYKNDPMAINPWTGEGAPDPETTHSFESVLYCGPSREYRGGRVFFLEGCPGACRLESLLHRLAHLYNQALPLCRPLFENRLEAFLAAWEAERLQEKEGGV